MADLDRSLRQFSGYAMKRAMAMVQADITTELAPFDLRMVTFSALVVIVDNPGLKQAQLADALAIERPNLVLILDELEQRDLIARNRDPDDRRAYLLQVTLAGRRLCDKALAAVAAHERRMTEGLNDPERQALIRALCRVEGNGKMKERDGTLSRA